VYKALLGFILISAIGLSACSVIPKAPTKKTPVDPPAVDLSTLEFKVTAPYAAIARELNQTLQNQLYWVTREPLDSCPVDECTYQVRVLRNGKVTVAHDGKGGIVVNLPIRAADGRVDIKAGPAKAHGDVEADVTATVALKFTMQPNWSAIPNVQLAFKVNKAQARVKLPLFGTYTISVRKKLTEALNSERNKLQRKIVEALNGKLGFRSKAASAWNNLHDTQLLNDQPPIWLMVDPVSLKVENLKAEADGLRMALGIEAYLSTHARQDAPPPPKPEALPNLKIVLNVAGRYKLSVPIRASIKEVNQLLDTLIGKEFTFEAADMTITAKLIDGQVYTNGPDLVAYAEVRTAKAIRVGAYLNGTPKYDAESTIVYLDSFDYDADTNNVLLDKAEWFLHGTIRENLQAALRLNIGEDLDNTRQLIAEKLRDMPLGERIVLHGTLDKFAARKIYTTEDSLNVDALAEGRINIELK